MFLYLKQKKYQVYICFKQAARLCCWINCKQVVVTCLNMSSSTLHVTLNVDCRIKNKEGIINLCTFRLEPCTTPSVGSISFDFYVYVYVCVFSFIKKKMLYTYPLLHLKTSLAFVLCSWWFLSYWHQDTANIYNPWLKVSSFELSANQFSHFLSVIWKWETVFQSRMHQKRFSKHFPSTLPLSFHHHCLISLKVCIFIVSSSSPSLWARTSPYEIFLLAPRL